MISEQYLPQADTIDATDGLSLRKMHTNNHRLRDGMFQRQTLNSMPAIL